MRKKELGIFLSVALLVSMAGCGGAEKEDQAGAGSASTAVSQSADSTSIEEKTEPEEDADSADTSSSEGEADTGEEDAAASSENEADAGDVDSTEALNVAEDAFTFDALVSQVGEPEADTLKTIGVEEPADTYNVKLFGEDASMVITSEEDVVQKITVTFPSSNIDSVRNAVSEQIAQDGEEEDKSTTWTFEDKSVSLSPEGDGCVIDIK